MSPRAIRQQIGQLLTAGFDGTTIPAELRALAREFSLGGVILFARNVESPEQVSEMARETRELVREPPPWFSVDQEGGRVARLRRPFTEWPPMASLGRADNEALARRFARALATELMSVGITLDFAPVLDVLTNSRNTVIGDRALSTEAGQVGRLGAVIIDELQQAGLAACGKHFPGHGDTFADSHHDLPLVEQPPERLREVEFAPFRAAVAAGVASIMMAHVLVPAFDDERPSSLSPVAHRMVREELGFDGVVFTDDLNMGAIVDRYPIPDAVVQALTAGCDGVLICRGGTDTQVAALEALIHAIEEDRVPYSRVEDALRRHHAMKERFMAQPVAARHRELSWRHVVGCESHAAIAAEMAQFV
jgi:beta-N-acetylhexosaminidase